MFLGWKSIYPFTSLSCYKEVAGKMWNIEECGLKYSWTCYRHGKEISAFIYDHDRRGSNSKADGSLVLLFRKRCPFMCTVVLDRVSLTTCKLLPVKAHYLLPRVVNSALRSGKSCYLISD